MSFLLFCAGFIVGATLSMIITALIATSHEAEKREIRYWEEKHRKEGEDGKDT